jgi:putative phosphoribosyl transferase
VVDDGIMTGNTIIPVLQWCKEREVSKLIVAAPVASTTFFPELATLCDELHVLVQDDDLYSEGQVYACFPVLQDEHVHELLERFSPEFH